MLNLAIRYRAGDGVPTNEERANEWVQKAVTSLEASAGHGDTTAMFALGSIYQFGVGVRVDQILSRQWLEKGSNAGDLHAMTALALSLLEADKDSQQAFGWASKAANAGEPGGMTLVAKLFSAGHGVARDEKQANAWLQKAADKGNAAAMRLLGERYDRGEGVAANKVEALKWLQKSAAAGNAAAMTEAGMQIGSVAV